MPRRNTETRVSRVSRSLFYGPIPTFQLSTFFLANSQRRKPVSPFRLKARQRTRIKAEGRKGIRPRRNAYCAEKWNESGCSWCAAVPSSFWLLSFSLSRSLAASSTHLSVSIRRRDSPLSRTVTGAGTLSFFLSLFLSRGARGSLRKPTRMRAENRRGAAQPCIGTNGVLARVP